MYHTDYIDSIIMSCITLTLPTTHFPYQYIISHKYGKKLETYHVQQDQDQICNFIETKLET